MVIARTSVSQAPFSGSFYPFSEREEVAEFLLDFYLQYTDDDSAYVLPFRINWLYGFGDIALAAPPGSPTPVHAFDFVLVDAEDTVVFDSTTGDYQETAWGIDRKVLQWTTDVAIARIVTFDSDRDTRDEHIEPEVGLVDGRTLNRLPRRLRSITANATKLTGSIRLQNGYNTLLTVSTDPRKDGGRLRRRVQIRCQPGIGEGRSLGCDEELPYVRSINGQLADEAGNFFLSADDCARVQLPVADGEYGAYSLNAETSKAAIFVNDDCRPCCPCVFYVNTYKGLKRMHSRWLEATQELESIRDMYKANRLRWTAQQECRTDSALVMICTAEPSCSAVFLVSYCNVTFSCLAPVELRLQLTLYKDGIDVTDTFAYPTCFQAYIKDSSRPVEEPFAFDGSWPDFYATFPFLSAQDSGTLRFRLCIANCEENMSVTATISVHYAEPEAPYNGIVVPIPSLDDGSAYGSVATTRAVQTLTRPVIRGSANCECD